MTYVPSSMPQPDRAAASQFAREIGFGAVIGHTGGQYYSAHVPIFVELDDSGSASAIRFHFAEINEMVSAIGSALEVLVIVRGPDGYISPEWYDHENVPTWDYAIVQFIGRAEPIGEPALKRHLQELLEKFDPGSKISDAYIDKYLSSIRGFQVTAFSLEPVFKLSQDKNEASVDGVIQGLTSRRELLDLALVEEIEKTYKATRDLK